MSKSKAGKQDKHRRATAGRSKGLVATALVLSFLLAGVALAVGGGLWSAQKKQSDTTTPNAIENLSPGSPAKEYVYAGGRLIATEEVSQNPVVDFDSDHITEIGFYRDGLWGFLKSAQNYSSGSAQFFSWGTPGLATNRAPYYGDFDGDGKTDLAYVAPASGAVNAYYAILRSTTGYGFGAGQPLFVSAGFPAAADVPVVGDFDGDGKADPSMWIASIGFWTIPKSSTNYTTFITKQWGMNGDIPIVCDLDGDGTSDMGFYRNGLWGFLKSSPPGFTSSQFFSWGGAGKQPVVGDFDGDGKADLGYVEPPAGGQSATYAILRSSRSYSFAAGDVLFVPAGFPALGDTPVVGDWDGDGKADLAIWRASQGVWIIPLSSSAYTTYLFAQWGQAGDIPMPNRTNQY